MNTVDSEIIPVFMPLRSLFFISSDEELVDVLDARCLVGQQSRVVYCCVLSERSDPEVAVLWKAYELWASVSSPIPGLSLHLDQLKVLLYLHRNLW